MDQYEWSSELETGYETIDEQHKQLVKALNDLLWACKHGGHRSELKTTVDFLVTYTLRHFADEEEFQVRYNYPGYKLHKFFHSEFKAVTSELADRLAQRGPSIGLAEKINSKLAGWLYNHVIGEDTKIVLHARKHCAGQPIPLLGNIK